jgi:hypothetical protein
MGLRSAAKHSHAAWLSSLSLTFPLVDSLIGPLELGSAVAPSLTNISNSTGQPWTSLSDLEGTNQHELSRLIDHRVHGQLMASKLTVRDKARLNALT